MLHPRQSMHYETYCFGTFGWKRGCTILPNTSCEMKCETRENKIKPNVLAFATKGNELSHQVSLKSLLQLPNLPKHTLPFHTYSLNLILIKKSPVPQCIVLSISALQVGYYHSGCFILLQDLQKS